MSEFLWVEKYRPKKISECILTEELKNTFTQFLNKKRYLIYYYQVVLVLVRQQSPEHYVKNCIVIILSLMVQMKVDKLIQ